MSTSLAGTWLSVSGCQKRGQKNVEVMNEALIIIKLECIGLCRAQIIWIDVIFRNCTKLTRSKIHVFHQERHVLDAYKPYITQTIKQQTHLSLSLCFLHGTWIRGNEPTSSYLPINSPANIVSQSPFSRIFLICPPGGHNADVATSISPVFPDLWFWFWPFGYRLPLPRII